MKHTPTLHSCSADVDAQAVAQTLVERFAQTPAALKPVLLDLVIEVRRRAQNALRLPQIPAGAHPLGDWTDLLALLHTTRRQLEAAGHASLPTACQGESCASTLNKRFNVLKHAFENTALVLEILYELVKVGHGFKTADAVLEESAATLLDELDADLFVCRLRRVDAWENIAADAPREGKTPIFVHFMEESDPTHPVMRAVHDDPEAMFVLSRDLRGPDAGGESFDCTAFKEGFRSRLAFILRDEQNDAFGLIMLYARRVDFFARFDERFLADAARIVSLTVERRLGVGRDALAKAAGGMAHVGNNILAAMLNNIEILIEELQPLETETRLLRTAGLGADPERFLALLDQLKPGVKIERLKNVVMLIKRLNAAVETLLEAVESPVLMPYVRGEEVLDLEPYRS